MAFSSSLTSFLGGGGGSVSSPFGGPPYLSGRGGGGPHGVHATTPPPPNVGARRTSSGSASTSGAGAGGGGECIQYDPCTLSVCNQAPLYPPVLEDFLEHWLLPHAMHPIQCSTFSTPSKSAAPLRRAMRDRRVLHFLSVWQDALFQLFSVYCTPKEAMGVRRALPPPFSHPLAPLLLPPSLSTTTPSPPPWRGGGVGQARASSLSFSASGTGVTQRNSLRPGGGGGGEDTAFPVLASGGGSLTPTPPPRRSSLQSGVLSRGSLQIPSPSVGLGPPSSSTALAYGALPRDVSIVAALTLAGVLSMAKELGWMDGASSHRITPLTITHCFDHSVADRRREANSTIGSGGGSSGGGGSSKVMFFSEFPTFLCALSYYYHVDPTETLLEKISAFLLEKVIPVE